MASSPDLRITGIGCVTSIGHTAAAAASAFRAGLSRPRPLTFVDVDGGPVTGRPVDGITDGFVQFGLWLRLALAAFDDLRANEPSTDSESWRRTALVACLPVLDEERFALPTGDVAGMLRIGFFEPLLEVADVPVELANCRHVFGHCGAAEALVLAGELLRADAQLRRVLVLGADSTCDVQSVTWLAATGRLKSPDNPVGAIPGEAGAAVMLERSGAAKEGGRKSLAGLHRAVLGSGFAADAIPERGRALAIAVGDAIAGAGIGTACDLYSDLNGEPWRAEALGHAMVHLQRRPPVPSWPPIAPATSLGEIGAASGLVALVFATRAFARRHARADHALVSSLEEQRAAAFVVTEA